MHTCKLDIGYNEPLDAIAASFCSLTQWSCPITTDMSLLLMQDVVSLGIMLYTSILIGLNLGCLLHGASSPFDI